MATVTVRKDLSVPLPANIVKRLAVQPGDKIQIRPGKNGEFLLSPARDALAASFGAWADMDIESSADWVNCLRSEWQVREERVFGPAKKQTRRR